MAPSNRQETARRAEILAVAAERFGEFGVRTSLEQIADACGIQAGSLYHHFDSKEAIYVELVARFRAELDRIAEQATIDPAWTSSPPLDRVTGLATAIAECATRNRGALLLTVFDQPPGSPQELVRLAGETHTTIRAAMVDVLHTARAAGHLRPGVDVDVLADWLCQSMLYVGIGVYHRARSARRYPEVKCHLLLYGVAVGAVEGEALDESAAMQAANEAIKTWTDDDGTDTAARIRTAARSEFARNGYELTTVRDIAAAAGLSPGGVYRHIDSKDELFWSIMRSYSELTAEGWNQVVRSPSTPLEKLDGLMWLLVNTLRRFAPEYRMQMFGLRYAPPTSPNLKLTFMTKLGQLKRVLAEGVRLGQLEMRASSMDLWARCVIGSIILPENIVREQGLDGALQLGRDALLRGVATTP